MLAIQVIELQARWIALALSQMLANLDDLQEWFTDDELYDLRPGEDRLPDGPELEAMLHHIRLGYESLKEKEDGTDMEREEGKEPRSSND